MIYRLIVYTARVIGDVEQLVLSRRVWLPRPGIRSI